MQFTKPMIELVYEIRRVVDAELKPAVKLANPELFTELQSYYHESAGAVAKAIIKELFHLAGEPWPSRLEDANAPAARQTVRVYRGQIHAEDQARTQDPSEKAAEKALQRKKRVYRGQVILG
ncbi:MAG TPA: hypothetical protein VIC26_15260 [Marinagarivorans sp.]